MYALVYIYQMSVHCNVHIHVYMYTVNRKWCRFTFTKLIFSKIQQKLRDADSREVSFAAKINLIR